MVEPNSPPECIFEDFVDLQCAGDRTSHFVDARESFDADGDTLEFLWFSSCPGAVFNDRSSASPVHTFFTSKFNEEGLSCGIELLISDSIQQVRCFGEVYVEPCQSCIDSEGFSNLVDRCGDCGGDGYGCLGCQEEDLLDEIDALILATEAQQEVAKQLRASLSGKRGATLLRRDLRRSLALARLNMELIDSMEPFPLLCAPNPYCIDTDAESTVDLLRDNSRRIKRSGYKAIRFLQRESVDVIDNSSLLAIKDRIRSLHAKNLLRLARLPDRQSSCLDY